MPAKRKRPKATKTVVDEPLNVTSKPLSGVATSTIARDPPVDEEASTNMGSDDTMIPAQIEASIEAPMKNQMKHQFKW